MIDEVTEKPPGRVSGAAVSGDSSPVGVLDFGMGFWEQMQVENATRRALAFLVDPLLALPQMHAKCSMPGRAGNSIYWRGFAADSR